MAELLTCVGRHLAPAYPRGEKISWYAASVDQARVMEWSCGTCPGPTYELCTLGARWFIRRTGREGIHETMRWRERTTRQLWAQLFAGAAR